MKKLLTILVMCFAVFAAKAQVTVILEAHDVWGDQSGYQLLLDADATAYGTIIPETGGLTSSGDADAATYAEFEYKIPENADGALSTSNIVFDGSVTITIPAGTYDFCVTNPTLGDRMWIASGDYGRQDDFVFQDGWTYHFTVAMNGQNDAVSLEVTPAGPAIVATPAALDFGRTLITAPATLETVITGYNLTDGITAAVTGEHYTISADGTNFATTASLSADGGTLYVQFAPATVDPFDGTITLTSGETTATIALEGEGFECPAAYTEFPYETDFSDEVMNLCWTIEDANNDDRTWNFDDGFAYYIYDTINGGNDWLISPVFTLTGNEMAQFDYAAYSSQYGPEKFEVYVIQGTTRTLVVPEVTAASTSLTTQYIDLSSYTGNYQVAIRCTSDPDKYALILTDFAVSTLESSLTTDVEDIDFGAKLVGRTAQDYVVVSTLAVYEDIAVSTTEPFSVSLDGTTFAATATIPASTELNSDITVYVRFAPTAQEEYTGTVTFTAGELTATVDLTGEGIECATITTFPYQTDFTDEAKNSCWDVENANNDDYTWEFNTSDGNASIRWNSALAADDWLISPTFTLTGQENLTFDYKAGLSSFPETFEVYVIQGETRTNIVPAMTVSNTDYETIPSVDLSSYTGDYMIGIHCTSAADMYRLYVTNFTIGQGVGIEEETAENAVAIYPNPATTMLNVHAENFDNVQVINFLGQVVYSANVTENDFQINVSNLSNGVYFIRLNGENTVTKKFVKK